MSLLSRLLSQCRQPRGWFGRVLARGMNRAHAPMTAWAVSQIPIQDARSVLDIGCGGGAAMLRLATLLPEAEVHGIDYSSTSLRVAARTNRRLIQKGGRVFFHQATVSRLPFAGDRFDLAVAIESCYFWPSLQEDLGEVLRVLRPGGQLLLAGGLYLGGRFDRRNLKLAAAGGMNCLTLSELHDLLAGAGYTDLAVQEEPTKGWFCAAGRKPAAGHSPQ